jgi:RNA polymerase sigma factor (sigma-70 family)
MTVPDLAPRLAHLAAAPGVPDAELLRRFADARDAAAFELLVWRYAGLVYGTARRALGNAADADDAFQAAFLALARKADTVRRTDSLGGWLHRVALRGALKLRAARARRAEREGAPLPETVARAIPLPDDTATAIDEELARLPEKLRVAFVLCELEGRTDAEAAAHLGCPKGTVLSRLSRAREKLRARLSRRGLAPLALQLAPVVVPPALVSAAARDAVPFATGAALEGAPAALARALTRPSVLKPALGTLALVLVAAGALFAARDREEAAPPAVPVRAEVAPPPRAVAPVPRVAIDLAALEVREVEDVLFSTNGKWLSVSARSGELKGVALAVWDAATGKHARTLTEKDGVQRGLGFSADGALFATSTHNQKPVLVWDTATWQQRLELAHPIASSASFFAHGTRVLTHNPYPSEIGGRGYSGATNVWDTATGKLALRIETDHERDYQLQTLAPDERTLLVAALTHEFSRGFGSARLQEVRFGPKPVPGLVALDLDTGKPLFDVPFPAGIEYPLSLQYLPLPARAFLIVGTLEHYRSAAVCDAATGKLVRAFGTAADHLNRAVPAPDGKWIAACGDDPRCWLWAVATGRKVAEFTLPMGYRAYQLWFTPDGAHWGATAYRPDDKETNEREFLTVFHSVATGKETARLPNVRSLTFAGRAVAVLSKTPDGKAKLEVLPVADLFATKP